MSVLSNQPTTVEDLDFKDNSYNSDQDFNMNMDNNAYLPPLGIIFHLTAICVPFDVFLCFFQMLNRPGQATT